MTMSGNDFLKSELVAKGVFGLGRCYIIWQGVPGLRVQQLEKHGYRRLIA